MKLELKEEKESPLLSRKRAKFRAFFDKETPSRDSIRKKVADSLKAKEELTIVKHIYPVFGIRESKVIAHVYENPEDMKRIEEKHILKKHIKEEKKEEEQEEKTEEQAEAKAEESSEKKKEEAKE